MPGPPPPPPPPELPAPPLAPVPSAPVAPALPTAPLPVVVADEPATTTAAAGGRDDVEARRTACPADAAATATRALDPAGGASRAAGHVVVGERDAGQADIGCGVDEDGATGAESATTATAAAPTGNSAPPAPPVAAPLANVAFWIDTLMAVLPSPTKNTRNRSLPLTVLLFPVITALWTMAGSSLVSVIGVVMLMHSSQCRRRRR